MNLLISLLNSSHFLRILQATPLRDNIERLNMQLLQSLANGITVGEVAGIISGVTSIGKTLGV